MKKKLFLPILMAMALVGCSDDDNVGTNADATGVENSYISINFVGASSGTRADDYEGTYDDGIEAEYGVTSILFYFFDKDGNPAIVDYPNAASYLLYNVATDDVTTGDGFEVVEDNDNKEQPNVTQIRKATLILKKRKDEHPAKIFAIVNPNDDDLRTNLSLGDLKDMHDVAEISDLTQNNKFVMTNSTYLDEKGQIIDAVSIDGHIELTADAAEDNPVTIYVERVVAKVTVEHSLEPVEGVTAETDIFDTQEVYGYGENEKKIYVKFLGWNVTATADRSFLVKSIDESWPNEALTAENLFQTAGAPWNYAPFFRSFWAINPDGVKYQYGPFYGDNSAQEYSVAKSGSKDIPHAYLQENAGKDAGEDADKWADAATEQPSQVIIAAQLVDEAGAPLELAEFAGQLFVDKEEKGYQYTKTAILSQLKEKYYKKSSNGEDEQYKQIEVTDLEIVSASSLKKDITTGTYYVYAQLSETAKEEDWYTFTDEEYTQADADDVNKALGDIPSAKIWNTGYTYYYFDIRHMADPKDVEDVTKVPGYYGVVRNHLYQCTVKTLSGLGTPVYDPEEEIIPEKPDEEEWYLAAQIKILSWHVVSQDVGLDWK